ncbi:MAG: ribosome biogenesis GTPase YlqF [Vulcanimicrobiaceae bacterium]
MSEATIQWYPGHMAKAMRRLADDVRLVDVVVEAVDARVPFSGANPSLARLAGNKPRLLVLTRADLADPALTERWLTLYRDAGRTALAVDAKERPDVLRLRDTFTRFLGARRRARALVLGIPNAGKSTLINALVGKNAARTEDRAGVTRAIQWFKVGPQLELMDTAGILVPKIEAADAQWKLALVGAVPRARFDPEDVMARFARWAGEHGHIGVPDLETFAQSRGFVRRGTIVDTHNAAWSYMKDWNEGKFGRMTLEEPLGP